MCIRLLGGVLNYIYINLIDCVIPFFSILAVWGVGRATGLGLQLHQSLVFSRGLAHNRSSINAYGMDADVSRLSVEA